MTHPAAEQARAARAARRYTDAAIFIERALSAKVDHPDLLCEQAISLMYSGREADALALLPQTAGAPRERLLARLLCEHYFCLSLQAPEDSEVWSIFEALRARHSEPICNVGIRLSACLIVKNEAGNLDRCLSSLHGIVDEIVVIDTGSTDETIAIARSHGAIVGTIDWANDFSAARNFSLDAATGDWALWIDADEELTAESAAAIRRAVVRPQFGGFDIEIVNFTDDREGGNEFRHSPTRLFRRIPGVRFTERIHEQVTPSLMALDLPWARLDGAQILHYGYRPEAMAAKDKLARTYQMLEREVRESPHDGFQWFNLANAYLVGKRYAEAEHAGRQAVRFMPDGVEFGRIAFHVLTQAANALGHTEAALAACEDADRRGFGGILNEFERAQTLMKSGRNEEALASVDLCMTFGWDDGMPGDRGILTHKRLVLRGQILAVLGRYSEAIVALESALKVDSMFAPANYSLGAVYERLGRFAEALAAFDLAVGDPDSVGLAQKGRGRVFTLLERYAEAAEAFRLAWEQSPDDYEAWVGWASACENWGDVPALLGAYEAFAQLQEPSPEILVNWGRALEAAGEPERALHCYTEAIKREPAWANAYFNCGDLLYRLGMSQDAAHLYETGLRHDPHNADAWFTLGNALAQTGLGESAATAYLKALSLRPDHVGARHNLGVITAEAA